MAQTLVRKVMLRIAADDGDTESKLDAISRKADELAAKHPDLKVKVDSAAASAKLAVLRKELKDTDGQSVSLKTRVGSLGQALNNSLLGGVSANVGEMSMLQKIMMGLNVATGLGEPLMAGLIVSTMGLSGGLLSAGLGAGIFGIAAKAAFGQVTAANTANVKLKGGLGELQRDLASATKSWDQFGKAASPGVAGVMGRALQLIPDALRLAQPFLGPTEAALRGIAGSLKAVMDPAPKISNLMLKHLDVPQLPGLSGAAATVQGTLKAMAAQSGPDLTKITTALGRMVVGILGVVRAFLPMSGSVLTGLDKMTGKFETWGETLSGHSGFQSLMKMFKQDTPTVIGLLKNLAGIAKTVIGEMTGMNTASNSRTLLQVAGALSGLVNGLLKAHPQLVEFALYMKMAADSGGKLIGTVKGISGAVGDLQTGQKAISNFSAGFGDAKKAADKATGAAGTYGGKISTLLQKIGLLKTVQAEATVATEGETVAQEELDGAMAINPIGLIVAAIAILVIAFVELWKHSAAFRDFWKAALKDVEKVGVAAWHFIDSDMLKPLMTGIDKLVTFVKGHWKTLAVILATVLLGPIAGLVVFIATHWAAFRRVTSEVVDDVTGFFRQLPGRIMGAIRALPGMMLSAGKNIVSMLVSGIESMAMAPVHAVEGIVGDVRKFLPFSPAKKGPLSGAGSPDIAGRKIGLMLKAGMESTAPEVSASAARLARAAQIGAGGHSAGYGAAGAGGAQKLQLELNITGGNAAFRTFLKKSIRTTGGDVSVVGA